MTSIRPRVLVADDYQAFVVALQRLLAFDCEVVASVDDGAAVLEAARQHQPDVIVLDINLPNMSGLDACREVASALPAINVIVVTGRFDAAIEERALAAGAAACLPKQAAADELISTIRRVSGCGQPRNPAS